MTGRAGIRELGPESLGSTAPSVRAHGGVTMALNARPTEPVDEPGTLATLVELSRSLARTRRWSWPAGATLRPRSTGTCW